MENGRGIRVWLATYLLGLNFLVALEGLVDPLEFFPLNRNYLVHWRAIARWEDEENGRRVKVWLKPPVYLPGKDGEEETFEYVSKEKAAQFRAWYAGCLSRHEAA